MDLCIMDCGFLCSFIVLETQLRKRNSIDLFHPLDIIMGTILRIFLYIFIRYMYYCIFGFPINA